LFQQAGENCQAFRKVRKRRKITQELQEALWKDRVKCPMEMISMSIRSMAKETVNEKTGQETGCVSNPGDKKGQQSTDNSSTWKVPTMLSPQRRQQGPCRGERGQRWSQL